MKNLKWFLGLVLALTFLAWSAPKVLAADDLKTNLETAIKQLQSALNLLAANDVVAPTNGDFGYYAPAWERGQVLGETDTCAPPPNDGCGPDSWFDQSACLCRSNNPPAPGGSTFTPGVCYQGDARVPCPTQNQPMVKNNQGGCPFFSYCNGKVVRKEVNGVMCDICEPSSQPDQQYQGYQPQQGQPGQMMGPNQQQGPSEEEMDKQRQQQEAKQLQMMKRDAGNVTKNLKQVKATITKATKLGILTPPELAAAIANIENYANALKNAKSMDDLASDVDLGDEFSVINEYSGFLNRMIELNKNILPQMIKSVKPFQTAYNRLVKKKIDVADFKAALDEINGYIAQIKAEAKSLTNSDDLDNLFDNKLADLGDKFENLGNEQRKAEFLANYKQGMTGFTAMLKKYTTAVNKAVKIKGANPDLVAAAKEQLAQLNNAFGEVKTAVNAKEDVETLIGMVDALTATADELAMTLEELGVGVQNVAMPQMSQQGPQPMQFNMPSSFNYNQQQPQQGPQITPNNQGGGQPQGQQMTPGTF